MRANVRTVVKTWILQGGELWKDSPGKNDQYDRLQSS